MFNITCTWNIPDFNLKPFWDTFWPILWTRPDTSSWARREGDALCRQADGHRRRRGRRRLLRTCDVLSMCVCGLPSQCSVMSWLGSVKPGYREWPDHRLLTLINMFTHTYRIKLWQRERLVDIAMPIFKNTFAVVTQLCPALLSSLCVVCVQVGCALWLLKWQYLCPLHSLYCN